MTTTPNSTESIERILSELSIYFMDSEDENFIQRISERISSVHDRDTGRNLLQIDKDGLVHPVFAESDIRILRDATGTPIQLEHNGKTYDVIENTLVNRASATASSLRADYTSPIEER